MVKRLALFISLLLIASLLFALPVMATHHSELWESYTENDDADFEMYGNIWGAQTFTVGDVAHTVLSVKLLLYREGTPGTITVSIRETTTGDPSGTDLASATLDGDDFTDAAAGVWYEFAATTEGYSLEASTMYAIVVRCEGGNAANSVHWRSDATAGAEADGQEETSVNAGATWTGDADDDFMFEVWGVSLLDVESAQVFRGYLEDDDMLFVINYYNVYVPYYPSGDPAQYFYLQLRSADGVDILAQTTCRAWGNKPGSIYLSADAAAGLTPGSLYRIYIYGDFAGTPSDYHALLATDWRGDDMTFLDQWVITTAHFLGEYYDTDFTTFIVGEAGQEVLDTEGGVIFALGIPGLPQIRPNLYELTSGIGGYDPEDWTHAFVAETTWQDQVGTLPAAGLTAAGTLFGVDGKAIGAFFLLACWLTIGIMVVGKGGDSVIAIILAVPFVLLGTWLRLIDVAIMGVTAGVVILMLMYRFWWSRT